MRYLSFQFHLTKGVQRHFFAVAAHSDLEDKPKLREFLVKFALEEEPHFRIAQSDLNNLGVAVLPCPLDVHLWHAYFDQVIPDARLSALERLVCWRILDLVRV